MSKSDLSVRSGIIVRARSDISVKNHVDVIECRSDIYGC